MLGECFGCFTGSLLQSRFACLTCILRSTGFGDDVSYVYSPNGLYPGDLKFLTFLRTDTLILTVKKFRILLNRVTRETTEQVRSCSCEDIYFVVKILLALPNTMCIYLSHVI